MKRFVPVVMLFVVASGSLRLARSQVPRTQSLLPAADYTITIELSDGTTYDLEVDADTLLSVESAPDVRPLPSPEPSLPLVYRGDVAVTMFRRASTSELESSTTATPTLGIAVHDGSVTIRRRDAG